jgi:hypothetical protein
MPSLESMRSSRRNLIRMGAVVTAAVVSRTMPASADRPRSDDDRDDPDHHEHHHHQEDRPRQKEHCFLKGTMIRTVHGDKKIEDLLVGDRIPTVFGGEASIKSIIHRRFGTAVRIARSALGPDLPNKDLYVSSPHALLIDGTLVAAGNLLNGTTITEPFDYGDFESFDIVFERHNVIYANGAPCETLLGLGEQPCAPRLPCGWRRGLIKSHLRSAAAPWIDFRQPVDVIRDGLDARGAALFAAAGTPA